MPFIPDVQLGALQGDTPEQKLESLVRQVNEWARIISNEQRTDIYKDTAGTQRILIGLAPDGEVDIGMSKATYDIGTLYT